MWPRFALQQVRQAEVDGVQRAVPVDLAHLQRLVERLVAERAVVGDAGVGDEQLQAAGALREAVDGGLRGGGVGDVALEDVVLARELGGERGELVGRARGEPECHAASGQRAGQRTPDAARGTGDERPRARRHLHGRGAYYDGPHDRSRHRRRGGVPPDALLAAGGRSADDGRQRRAGHAALAPDGPRDDRSPRARRLHHARGRQDDLLHRHGRRARRGRRAPPSPDRALPHRRPRDPVGRGPRGGRALGARDVARARGAHARRHRRREDVPARAPDRGRRAHRGRPAGRRRARAPPSRSCAWRTRPRTSCTT